MKDSAKTFAYKALTDNAKKEIIKEEVTNLAQNCSWEVFCLLSSFSKAIELIVMKSLNRRNKIKQNVVHRTDERVK